MALYTVDVPDVSIKGSRGPGKERIIFFMKQFLLPNSGTFLDFCVFVKVIYLISGIEISIKRINCAYKNFDCETVTP